MRRTTRQAEPAGSAFPGRARERGGSAFLVLWSICMVRGESICPYCGVGCRLRLDGPVGPALRVRGVADAPANLGKLCAKGALLGETIDAPDRILRPQLRRT